MEVVVNALAHRDYLIQGSEVHVDMYLSLIHIFSVVRGVQHFPFSLLFAYGKHSANELKLDGIQCLTPVSYTHLIKSPMSFVSKKDIGSFNSLMKKSLTNDMLMRKDM